jgi:hypothetical protein
MSTAMKSDQVDWLTVTSLSQVASDSVSVSTAIPVPFMSGLRMLVEEWAGGLLRKVGGCRPG